MKRSLSYYELFGVTPDATAAELRAAYVALVKRHHPDSRDTDKPNQGPELLPLINRCYAVLKDPAKRAEYDERIRLRRARRRRTKNMRTAAGRSKLNISSELALVLVAIVIAVTPVLVMIGRAAWIDRVEVAEGSDSAGEALLPAHASFPSGRQIGDQVRLATSVPVGTAVTLSQNCYRNATAQSDVIAAQLCVVFDETILYSSEPPASSAPLPLYFNHQLVGVRQNGALAPFASDSQERLSELRRRAFLALSGDIRRNSSALGESAEPLPAAANATNSGAPKT